ncbi:hypothetical protein [Egbenema bharatensis]
MHRSITSPSQQIAHDYNAKPSPEFLQRNDTLGDEQQNRDRA